MLSKPLQSLNDHVAASLATAIQTKRRFLMTATCSVLTQSAAAQIKEPVNYTSMIDIVRYPELPFSHEALLPYFSSETLSYHHGQHHVGHFKSLTSLAGNHVAGQRLPELIRHLATDVRASPDPALQAQYNAAGQLWNHNIYWAGLRPSTSGPSRQLQRAIERDFGSTQVLVEMLRAQALELFGSGWVWIAANGDSLSIVSTYNADTLLLRGLRPLWVLDVWEHAYYIDQRNKRAAYIDAVLQNLMNWDFIAVNYQRAWESS